MVVSVHRQDGVEVDPANSHIDLMDMPAQTARHSADPSNQGVRSIKVGQPFWHVRQRAITAAGVGTQEVLRMAAINDPMTSRCAPPELRQTHENSASPILEPKGVVDQGLPPIR